jgi:alpha-tubulin suppressor-like RCC1 family protein
MNLKELNFLNSKTRRKIAAGAISVAMGFSIVAPNISAALNVTGIQVSTVKAFADEVTQQGIKKIEKAANYVNYFLTTTGKLKKIGFNNTTIDTNIKDFFCASDYLTFIIKTDGTVWARGDNHKGSMGTGDNKSRDDFVPINIDNVKKIVTDGYSTYFLKNDGTVYSCGDNGRGELGLGDNTDRLTPTKMDIDNVEDIIINDSSAVFFIKNDKTVWSCGYNSVGKLGLNDTTDRNTPTKVPLDDIKKVIAGAHETLFLTNDGKVYAVGYDNGNGAFGTGVTSNTFTTLTQLSITEVKDVFVSMESGSGYFGGIFFIKNDNSIWVTGSNQYGQLGTGDTSGKLIPTKMSINDVKKIVSNGESTYFIKNDNTVWSCGRNYSGQLGLGDENDRLTPIKININNIKDVIISQGTFLIKDDNSAMAMGYNYEGALGTGDTSDKSLPTPITSQMLYDTSYTIDKIYNMADENKYGSWLKGFYSKSLYDDNQLMQFILNSSSGTATLSSGGVFDSSQVKNKYFLSDGSMILIDNYGMIQYYKDLTTASPATLSIDGSGVIGADLVTFGSGTSAVQHPVLYFDDHSQYIDTDGTLKTFSLKKSDVKDMFAYKYANGVSQVMLVEKSDGSLVYFDKDGNQQDFGLNMNDVSYIIPATNVNKDIFVMKDGTLRDDKGVVAIPDGLTLKKVWSNRFFEMSDGMLYALQNGTFKNTNTLASFAKLALNNALLLKNGNFQTADTSGTLTNDMNVGGNNVTYMSQLDSTNQYLILNDGTTYGIGTNVQGDKLEDHGINIGDVSSLISNGTTGTARALVTKDGTVYSNPGSWAKNTLVHFSSDAVNSAHDSNPVYTNDEDVINDYNNSGDPNLINKTPGGSEGNTQIGEDIAPQDTTGPAINVTGNPTDWTNKDITLSVSASDEEGGSGFNKIVLPDNSEITTATGTFKVTQNGTYTFKAYDKAGNMTTKEVSVSKIDKVAPAKPSIDLTGDVITITPGTDGESGVKETEYSINDGEYQKYTGPVDTTPMHFDPLVGYNVKARTVDNVGNVSEIDEVGTIPGGSNDYTYPKIDITGNPADWVNNDVNLNFTTSDNQGIYKTVLPDGSESYDLTGTYKVTKNGTYTFKTRDNAGNWTTKDVVVDKIDKTAPGAPTISNDSSTVTITGTDAESGVKEVDYSVDGGEYQKYTEPFTLEAGSHTVKAKTIDNAGNTSTEASKNITIEDLNSDLQKATEAVENAENTKKQEDVDSARDLVDALPDSPEKQDLEDRLDAVQDEIDNEQKLKDATDAVDHAEDTHSQEDLDHAKDLVDDLPDGPAKDGLEDRIDDIQDEIDQSSQEAQDLADAIAAVEKAEQTKTKSDYDTAVDKVSALKDGTDKTGLQGRLDKVKSDVDALIKAAGDAVAKAESTKTEEDINAAQGAIDKVPDGWDISDLQNRLDNIKKEVGDQNLAAAKAAVEKAESTQLQEDVDSARILVNKLTSGQDKTDLSRRLDAVQDIIDLYKNAEQRVQTAEKLKTEYAVSSARSVVSELPDGDRKNSLNARLDAVEAEIALNNTIEAIDKDITALEKDVDSHIKYNTTMDIESYRNKVTALRDKVTALPDSVSDTKSGFNERLDTIDSKLTTQKDVQDAIKKVEDALDKAGETLSDEDIQDAQDAIDDLPDGVDKSKYQDQLDIIKQKKQAKVAKDTIDANKAVTKASRTRLQIDIDAARTLVNALPDGNNKTQLSKQLDLIQKYVRK